VQLALAERSTTIERSRVRDTLRESVVRRHERSIAERIVTRTVRAERVPAQRTAFTSSTPARSAAAVPMPVVMEASAPARVLRHTKVEAELPPMELAAPAPPPRVAPASALELSPLVLRHVTDEVIRNLDRRVSAYRERQGRV
jgi:hypothetical protein